MAGESVFSFAERVQIHDRDLGVLVRPQYAIAAKRGLFRLNRQDRLRNRELAVDWGLTHRKLSRAKIS